MIKAHVACRSRIAQIGRRTARTELQASLASLPADSPEQLRRRAEVHCDLSAVCFWLLDIEGIGDHARSALDLATQIGAHEMELAARTQLTSADSATGDVDQVLVQGRALISQAAALGIEPPYERLGGYSLQLYLTGDWQAAINVAREALRTGRGRGDTQLDASEGPVEHGESTTASPGPADTGRPCRAVPER